MRRDEVVACLLMESVSEPSKPQNVEVFDKSGLFYLRFDSNLQDYGINNRNRRDYDLNAMKTSLNAPHIAELMSKKSWMGEAGHPDSDKPARILTIDPTNISHKINSFEFRGNRLHGRVETLDNGGVGLQMTKNILQGMEPAFSLRAMARLVKRADGSSLMNTPCHVVAFDWVILPSHKVAYRDTTTPIEKVYQSIQENGNILTEPNVEIPILESQIKDFIAMESANVNLVSSIYEVAMESMQLTPDGNYVIMKEGTNTFAVKIEDRIKHDTARYMSRLF